MTQVIPVLRFPKHPGPSLIRHRERRGVLDQGHEGLALTQLLCDAEQALPSLSLTFSTRDEWGGGILLKQSLQGFFSSGFLECLEAGFATCLRPRWGEGVLGLRSCGANPALPANPSARWTHQASPPRWSDPCHSPPSHQSRAGEMCRCPRPGWKEGGSGGGQSD